MKIGKIKDNELEEAIVMVDKNTKLTEVLVEYPSKKIDKTFTYIIPDNLKARIKVGMHVSIPFVNKIINGFVLKIIDNYDGDYELKTIVDIIDEEIVLNQELMGIANYLHEETLSPLILIDSVTMKSDVNIIIKYTLIMTK